MSRSSSGKSPRPGRVLVLGGAGFLGSYVVDELLSRGYRVTIFDKKRSRFHADTPSILGDLLDARAVDAAVRGSSAVYNFAGLADLSVSVDHPLETVSLNVMGNMNALEACRRNKIPRFVFASTVYVYSTAGAFYGASKKCAEILIEQYSRQFNLDYTIIRYGSVYGERADVQNRIYRLVREALAEGKISFLGDGSEEREYIHGRDAAKLSVDILAPSYRNNHVILTGVERYKYADLLKLIQEILGEKKVRIKLLNREYKGHYRLTPYTFSPSVGRKLFNNPCVDFGQGLLECIEAVYRELGAHP